MVQILTACKHPFYKHLQMLPQELHMASLYACFPAVSTSASFNVQLRSAAARCPCTASGSAKGNQDTQDGRHSCCKQYQRGYVGYTSPGLLQLPELTLSPLSFSAMGSSAPSLHFRGLSDMRQLYLRSCVFQGEGHKRICQLCLTSLCILDLQGSCIEDKGAQALAQSIP